MTERVDVAGAGMDPVRVARVVAKFRRQQAEGVFPGGQLVVRRRGRLVVDEAVGVARGLRAEEGEPRREFSPEQRSCVFSAGKPLVGIAITAPLLAKYITRQSSGTDRTVRMPLVLGRGFALGWCWPHPYGWWRTRACFGHAGNFSTVAWADPTTGCAIAAVTNGNRAPAKLVTRFAGIGSGLRAACIA